MTFRSGGHRLTVITRGVFSAVLCGATKPIRGWHFPSPGRRLAAAEFAATGTGWIRTTFAVT